MADKKNYKRRGNKKKYSFVDRMSYYSKKADSGKTIQEEDYAFGYLQGMRGINDKRIGSDAANRGNDAGLRFWSKLTNVKIR